MFFRVWAVPPNFPENLLSDLLPRSLMFLVIVIFRKEKEIMLTGEYTFIHTFLCMERMYRSSVICVAVLSSSSLFLSQTPKQYG